MKALLLPLLLASRAALAQLAPIGAHLPDGASVGGDGGASVTVPLALPPPRGGLPMPLKLVPSGNVAGAGGRGWDVPLSYVHLDASLAHRRPSRQSNAPVGPQQLTVTLLGQTMVFIADGTDWVPQRNDPGTVLRRTTVGWKLYDGNGLTYTFSHHAPFGIGCADGGGAQCVEQSLTWLLDRIDGPGNARVDLEYDVGRFAQTNGKGPIYVNLERVTYNHAEGSPKHEIELTYTSAGTTVSRSIAGAQVLERRDVLERIDVLARATPGGELERIGRYRFEYEPDPDTGLPRLVSVDASGRQGPESDEEEPRIPVAHYGYGTATTAYQAPDQPATSALRYERVASVLLPFGADYGHLSRTYDSGNHQRVTQKLVDMTGDGRLDLVFQKNGSGLLWLARNWPSPVGGSALIDPGPVNNDELPVDHLDESRRSAEPRQCVMDLDCPAAHWCDEGACLGLDTCPTGGTGDFICSQIGHPGYRCVKSPSDPSTGYCSDPLIGSKPLMGSTTTDVWRQVVDVNGDGREDVIVANEVGGYSWVYYINEPAGGSEWHKTNWLRRVHSVAHLAAELKARGHVIDPQYLPISRHATGVTFDMDVCWMYDAGAHAYVLATAQHELEDHEPWQNPCNYLVEPPAEPDFFIGVPQVKGQSTITLWKLTDLNGDGGLDLVYDTSPTTVEGTLEPSAPPPDLDPAIGARGKRTYRFGVAAGAENELWAVFNVTPFEPQPKAAPVPLLLSECGVETWTKPSETRLSCEPSLKCDPWNSPDELDCCPAGYICFPHNEEYCGLPNCEDVPPACVLKRDDGDQRQVCDIADINGDGLADYLSFNSMSGGVATLGNGRGFTSGRLGLPGAPLYHHSGDDHEDVCQPPATEWTATRNAYRDLTGDGVPDFISVNDGALEVRIGSGTGFADAIPIVGSFTIDHQREACGGSSSETLGGLYDLDGDGIVEVVSAQAGFLHIGKLVGSDGVGTVAAGRLTKVENGYGATTTFTYRSAKDDSLTAHQVPFPEIVISKTRVTTSPQAPASETFHAYGGAFLEWSSLQGAFTFPGYRRVVKMTASGPNEDGGGTAWSSGVVEIVDSQGTPPPPAGSSDVGALFGPHLLGGRARDITMLTGTNNAWGYLGVDVSTHPSRIGGTHLEYETRAFGTLLASPNELDCVDVIDPYGDPASSAVTPLDRCRTRGFVATKSTTTWHGTAAPPSLANVETRTVAEEIDDLARPTRVLMANDTRRNDDDVCVMTEYAEPEGTFPRILLAVSKQRVTACGDGVGAALAVKYTEYDHLPPGLVNQGLVTFTETEVRDTETGDYLGTVRGSAIEHDDFGNPRQITDERTEDGQLRIVKLTYDSFGLAVVHNEVLALEGQTYPEVLLATEVVVDPVTLQVLQTVNPNGLSRGSTFDRFGREVLTTIAADGREKLAVARKEYLGFERDDPEGRRIAVTTFSEPVPIDEAESAGGSTSVETFDELGRTSAIVSQLGPEYGNVKLVLSAPVYDGLGRVVFAPDAHDSGSAASQQYGTSYFFNLDGTPSCAVRAHGPLAQVTTVTDEAAEVYPSCISYAFANGQEITTTTDAAAMLPGSPQSVVRRHAKTSAIGRMLEQHTTVTSSVNSTEDLERKTFEHDRLGNLIAMTRYRTAGPIPVEPVTWRWHYDSLGHMRREEMPESVDRVFVHDSWGELTERITEAGGTSNEQKEIMVYDGLGRVVHREEQDGGVADADTIKDYVYDTASSGLGLLASATAAAGRIELGYDGLGRVAEVVRYDAEGRDAYIERTRYTPAGLVDEHELQLPDTSYDAEVLRYAYDSRGALRSVTDQKSGTPLYEVASIDVFGRVREATLGAMLIESDFASAGRRLPLDITITTPKGTRSISFEAFDPVGRELERREDVDGEVTTWTKTYDLLGRLDTSVRANGSGVVADRTYGYDYLGNIVRVRDDVGDASVGMQYQAAGDLDRLCFVGYKSPDWEPDQPCNVSYDAVGNITSQATRDGMRETTYFASEAVKTISNERGTLARFRYDALGALAELDVEGGDAIDERRERYFGSVTLHDETRHGGTEIYLERKLDLGGMSVSRRGAWGPWVFSVSEERGGRFFTDESGVFVQEVDYADYGEPDSKGEQPGSRLHSSAQWNDGNALADFGVSHLGARIYDPVIGRFTSRDPIRQQTSPYSFAGNNPVGNSDPTGLCPGCVTDHNPSSEPGLENCGAGGATNMCELPADRRAQLDALNQHDEEMTRVGQAVINGGGGQLSFWYQYGKSTGDFSNYYVAVEANEIKDQTSVPAIAMRLGLPLGMVWAYFELPWYSTLPVDLLAGGFGGKQAAKLAAKPALRRLAKEGTKGVEEVVGKRVVKLAANSLHAVEATSALISAHLLERTTVINGVEYFNYVVHGKLKDGVTTLVKVMGRHPSGELDIVEVTLDQFKKDLVAAGWQGQPLNLITCHGYFCAHTLTEFLGVGVRATPEEVFLDIKKLANGVEEAFILGPADEHWILVLPELPPVDGL